MTIPNYNTKILPLIEHPEAQGYERKGFKFNNSIPTISTALEGFERGELIAITAPPGHGKTMLARTFCMDLIGQGLNCLYLSYELTYRQLLGLFKLSGLSESKARKLILAPLEYQERDITFVESLISKNEIDVLVVDDIHSLEEKYSMDRRSDNMALLIRGLAQRLKNLAIKKDIVIITMAHQRKDSIDNKKSSLSEIAYSGGIAQVCDTVLSLKKDSETGDGIVEITKSRWSGSMAAVRCKAVNKIFKEYEHYELPANEVIDKFRFTSQKEMPLPSLQKHGKQRNSFPNVSP